METELPKKTHFAYFKKTYSSSARVKEHIIIEHEDSAEFQCNTCLRKFATGAQFRTHVKQVHTKVTCEICNEILYNWFYLRKHRHTVHGILPPNVVKCDLCPMFFNPNSVHSFQFLLPFQICFTFLYHFEILT